MFTGLIEEIGSLQTIVRQGESLVLTIRAKRILDGICLGDSIAVNGACLTVIRFDTTTVSMDVTAETFRLTTLHRLGPGERVNLERAMQATSRFGGHIVQGHVDGTGFIVHREVRSNTVYYTIETGASSLVRYIIPKGSVTVDGISLTVVDTDERRFRVSIIPHTLAETALQYTRPGDSVNLETDLIGKYVEHLLSRPAAFDTNRNQANRNGESRLSEAFLKEHGFY